MSTTSLFSKYKAEWRMMLSRQFLREDCIAGITVAGLALPLSLAIALASGVEPALGLVTAVIAGVVCALFGGARLAVSGPAAAMAILVEAAVEKHGLGGLLVIGLLVGVLQLLSGFLRLGRFARLVPVPVIAGFTAGIGATILIQQAPRALGLPPPDSSHAFDVIKHAWDMITHTNVTSLALALSTLGIIFLLPRLCRECPRSSSPWLP